MAPLEKDIQLEIWKRIKIKRWENMVLEPMNHAEEDKIVRPWLVWSFRGDEESEENIQKKEIMMSIEKKYLQQFLDRKKVELLVPELLKEMEITNDQSASR